MSYELRKILGNRYVMLLLALAVAVNAALFYRRCTKDLGGFTRADVRAEYAHLDTLEQEYDALLNGIYGEDVDIMQVPDEDLRRCALLSTVRDEVETTKNYPEYLRGLCAETEAKLRLGLFSADPFAERTLEKGLAAYSALLGVRLEPSFPDGVEVLLDWRLTDLLLLLFAAVSGLVLLTGERSAGLMVLLRPTRRGHGALYWRKAAAMLATVLAGVVLLYGANLAVSSAVLGLGDPARPIQTIPSMQSCPVPLTVFGWLLCFLGEKLLWGWAVGALFFLLCTTTGRAWAAFLLAGGGAGLALLLGSRGSLWPRLLSLSRAAEVEESWRGCIYLNFFGLPLRQTALLPAMLLLLTVGGCLGGAGVFCRTQAVQPVRQRRGLPLPRLRHTVLLAYEARKLLLTGVSARPRKPKRSKGSPLSGSRPQGRLFCFGASTGGVRGASLPLGGFRREGGRKASVCRKARQPFFPRTATGASGDGDRLQPDAAPLQGEGGNGGTSSRTGEEVRFRS